MKKLFQMIFLLSISCHLTYGQSTPKSITLEYITEFQIKIDGGVSYYTFDTTGLDSQQYILITSPFIRTAFMKPADEKNNVYLKSSNRSHKLPEGHADTTTFAGEGYTLKMNTHKVREIDSVTDLYKGQIIIRHRNQSATINVQGTVPAYRFLKSK